MKNVYRALTKLSTWAVALVVSGAQAQDWPQWRGPDRDAKAAGFKAPATWPKQLTQKWKAVVGEGVATPALVGDRLFVFSRQEGSEIIRCLDTATGKELWSNNYDALGATGPASQFSGPRSSPAVAGGKVVTLGVRGVLSCLDCVTGKLLWRKDDFQGAWPRFFTASSPIVVDGLCIAQLGGAEKGAIVVYDLTTGSEKWKWTGDVPGYASPVVATVGGSKFIVALTDTKVVALSPTDGKLAWETPFVVQGRGYNAATPIVEGQTLIYTGSGRGTTAVKLQQQGAEIIAKELWKNTEQSVQFNTPVLRNGLLFGLNAGNDFFCLNTQDGKTAWSAPAGVAPPPAPPPPGAQGQGPGGGRGGRGMRGGGGGFGSLVDAGSVILALTPASQLIAFQPSDKAYAEVARIKVADTPTHAYPVATGNRIFIKDQDSVILWMVQ